MHPTAGWIVLVMVPVLSAGLVFSLWWIALGLNGLLQNQAAETPES